MTACTPSIGGRDTTGDGKVPMRDKNGRTPRCQASATKPVTAGSTRSTSAE